VRRPDLTKIASPAHVAIPGLRNRKCQVTAAITGHCQRIDSVLPFLEGALSLNRARSVLCVSFRRFGSNT
jgi:hypothetical protein